MHVKKRYKIFIALIALLYLISAVSETYAKYTTNAEASTNISIARWNILINNQDIRNNSNFSNTISPTIDTNSNIATGVIAPTSTGYFDVIINGNNTDVSYQYTLTIDHPDNNTVTDFNITKYTINDDPTEYTFDHLPETINNNILVDQENKIESIRFYVEWTEGDGENLDNHGDTQQTINGLALFKINVNVIQLAN